MSWGPFLTLVLVPHVVALICGWAVRHWAVALVVLTFSVGCLYAVPLIDREIRNGFAGALTGAAVASFVLLLALLWKPNLAVLTRMGVVLVSNSAAHILYLQAAFRQI